MLYAATCRRSGSGNSWGTIVTKERGRSWWSPQDNMQTITIPAGDFGEGLGDESRCRVYHRPVHAKRHWNFSPEIRIVKKGKNYHPEVEKGAGYTESLYAPTPVSRDFKNNNGKIIFTSPCRSPITPTLVSPASQRARTRSGGRVGKRLSAISTTSTAGDRNRSRANTQPRSAKVAWIGHFLSQSERRLAGPFGVRRRITWADRIFHFSTSHTFCRPQLHRLATCHAGYCTRRTVRYDFWRLLPNTIREASA